MNKLAFKIKIGLSLLVTFALFVIFLLSIVCRGSVILPLFSDKTSVVITIASFAVLVSYIVCIVIMYKGEEETNLKKIISVIFDYVAILFNTLCIVLLIFIFIIFPVKVNMTSMMPNIAEGDRMIISTNTNKLEREDIVVFRIDSSKLNVYGHDDELWIKRVIGLPGDSISFIDGQLYVNGEVYTEDYLMENGTFKQGSNYNCKMNLTYKACKTLLDVMMLTGLEGDVIPDGYYLLLGDNRQTSYDSWSIGLVPEDLIVGKAVVQMKSLFDIQIIK